MRHWSRLILLDAVIWAIVMGRGSCYSSSSSSSSDSSSSASGGTPEYQQNWVSSEGNNVDPPITKESPNVESSQPKPKKQDSGTREGSGLKALSTGKQKTQKVTDTVTKWDATSCERRDKFSGYVFVQHALKYDDDAKIDDKMLSKIAKGFLDTYNKLNSPDLGSNVCDKTYMRLIESVEVTALETTYVKTEGQSLYQRNFLYNITGYGIGTTEDTPVFERGNVQRKTFSSDDEGGIKCTCSVNLEEQRAPTEEEFKESFRKKIKSLSREGMLKNIKDVYKVIEYDAVDCGGWNGDFETSVALQFSVDPTKRDYNVLLDSFQNSYNHLNVNYCDPNFRHVTHVEIADDDGNGRLLRGRVARVTKKRRRRKDNKHLRFRVRGGCKGCKRRSRIFDDKNARRLKEDNFEDEEQDVEPLQVPSDSEGKTRLLDRHWDRFDWHHHSEGRSTCFCASHPKALRAPTLEEFAKRYNATLQTADVSYEYQVKQVLEETYTFRRHDGDRR